MKIWKIVRRFVAAGVPTLVLAVAGCATAGAGMTADKGMMSGKAARMAMDPMAARMAVIDRFSAAAGHLQMRDAMDHLPGANAPVDFDQPPFVTTGFGPHGETVMYYNFDAQSTTPAPIYVLFHLWAWLIHNRDFTSGCAHIGAQSGEKHIEIKLCLENTLPDQVSIPARDIADKQLLQDFRYELTMIYKPGEGEIGTTTTVRPSPDRYPSLSVRYDGPPPSWPAKSVSISPCPGLRSGVVEMFSELAKTHDDEHVLKVAKRVEKRLERLSVQLLGAQPLLHADLGGKELVPLRLMGDGFQRLVEILVVIFAARGGVVLIDEIENGLHYSALRELWGAIYEASQAAGVQIFATTHSYECIKTAHEVFREHDPYRLRLHRLDFDEKRGTFATTFDKDTLEAALDHLWEIR